MLNKFSVRNEENSVYSISDSDLTSSHHTNDIVEYQNQCKQRLKTVTPEQKIQICVKNWNRFKQIRTKLAKD